MISEDGPGRFRRGGFRVGYAVAEVDVFCRRVDEELRQRRAGRRLSAGLTPEEVRNVHFSDERGGYRLREVDAFLDEVVSELYKLQESEDSPTETAPEVTPPGAWSHELQALLSVSTRPPGERFGLASPLLQGYESTEVDQFVERVRTALPTSLTPSEVAGSQFETVRRGYAMEEVDQWLDEVEAYAQRRQDRRTRGSSTE